MDSKIINGGAWQTNCKCPQHHHHFEQYREVSTQDTNIQITLILDIVMVHVMYLQRMPQQMLFMVK